ncbi:MAG: cupredoxin domain-containing protein, partial [Acidimicrobiia bacterium]|nr:cupredoxin domain-containing protein [Acidimicrobiia bacterium]
LDPGQSYQFTFTAAGTYPYVDERDEVNPAYQGTITVSAQAPPDDSGGGGSTPPPAAASGDVSIVNRSFQPGSLTVGVGATVGWANNDDRVHTVTSTTGLFDSGIFDTGGTYNRTFTSAGTFNYFCTVHPDMVASITVVGSGGGGGESPPPSPPPSPIPPPAPINSDVSIFDFGFTPGSLTLNVGDSVSWANTGAAPHTVTDRAGSFDSGFLSTGESYTRTFSAPGSFSYFCTLHPEMTASVTVLDTGGGGAAVPQPVTESGTTATPGTATASARGDVAVIDNAFSPRSISVAAGTTITWANQGVVPHTITANDGGFDSGFLMPGKTYRRTFSSSGTYDYFCSIHPGMVGTVNVLTSSGTLPAGAAGTTVSNSVAGLLARALIPQGSAEVGVASSADGPSSWLADIIDFDFEPAILTVEPGDAITWTNRGEIPHTVTARDLTFDSEFVMTGESFSISFTEPGTYEYFCTLHPNMVGTVVVEARAGAPPGESEEVDSAAAASEIEAASLLPTGTSDSDVPVQWLPLLVIGVLAAVIGITYLAAFGVGGAAPEDDS